MASYEAMKQAFEGLNVTRKITPGYAHFEYYIAISPPPANAQQYSARDGALYADYGNLCFGGRNFRVTLTEGTLVFTGVVHTD